MSTLRRVAEEKSGGLGKSATFGCGNLSVIRARARVRSQEEEGAGRECEGMSMSKGVTAKAIRVGATSRHLWEGFSFGRIRKKSKEGGLLSTQTKKRENGTMRGV